MNAGNFCHPENPGSTHWSGCECHEARWTERLAAADALNASQADQIRVIYEQLTAAEARIRELEGALRSILRWDEMDEPRSHERMPLECCPSCIARAALAPPPEDEKRGGE